MIAIASAQPSKQATPASPPASVLEAKVRKAWEDFKNKDKHGFAAILADGFAEVEDDGAGSRDAKAEVAEIDEFNLDTYTLKDFKIKPIGAAGALVTYMADYTVSGQSIHQKAAYGEVWIRRGNDWKLLYVQETKVK
jgi:hypothetical protein